MPMPEIEPRLLIAQHAQEYMPQSEKVGLLRSQVENIYQGTEAELSFHGWHHVTFVAEKGKEFAFIEQQRLHAKGEMIAFDENLPYFVEAVGLVHDLNYLITKNSSEGTAENLRKQILQAVGYQEEEIQRIEDIVQYKDTDSLAAQCFHDADDAAKVDGELRKITEGKFIQEQGITRKQLVERVVKRQLLPIRRGERPLLHTSIALEQYGEILMQDLLTYEQEYLKQKETQMLPTPT